MAREAERQAREGRPLEGLLSARLISLLSRYGITTENQLREVRDEDLLRLPGFGLQSLAEVKGAIPEASFAPPPRSQVLNQPPLLPPATVRGRAAPDAASSRWHVANHRRRGHRSMERYPKTPCRGGTDTSGGR